jgi:PAS domain-containing protein
MDSLDWIKEFPAAVTVCDTAGIILDMNDRAAAVFEADGGRQLIGKSMLDFPNRKDQNPGALGDAPHQHLHN